jgi:hypothetical protein
MKVKNEHIKKENIIKQEDDVVDSPFRASFAHPSSPPSALPLKRPSPDPDPIDPIDTLPPPPPPPPPSPFLTLTVAPVVARPTPVQQDDEGNNDHPAVQVLPLLRRSTRKRNGNTRPSLDTGDGLSDRASDTRPSKKKKRRRGGNPRAPELEAPEEDLAHLGGLPEHLAEDLDGTFPPPNLTPTVRTATDPTTRYAAFWFFT